MSPGTTIESDEPEVNEARRDFHIGDDVPVWLRMKLGSVSFAGAERPVDLTGGAVVELSFPGDLLRLIRSGADPRRIGRRRALPVDPPPRLRAPLRPGKIVAIGLNYLDHIRETGMEAPVRPLVFSKFPSAVVGPYDEIVIDPALAERVDWEVELAVVIGRRMRSVREREALDHVFGYTVANDVSARDVQFSDGQWVRGKSFDTFCPLGPFIATPDEVPDPQALVLRTRVNGQVVQESSTREMVFGVAELLSYCSRSFTLEPGDVLLTGTPWGCGEFMQPRRSLRSGDVVEVEVEGIGVMTNPVVVRG